MIPLLSKFEEILIENIGLIENREGERNKNYNTCVSFVFCE